MSFTKSDKILLLLFLVYQNCPQKLLYLQANLYFNLTISLILKNLEKGHLPEWPVFPCVVVVKTTRVSATSHFFVAHGKEKVFATDPIANCICTKTETKNKTMDIFFLDYKVADSKADWCPYFRSSKHIFRWKNYFWACPGFAHRCKCQKLKANQHQNAHLSPALYQQVGNTPALKDGQQNLCYSDVIFAWNLTNIFVISNAIFIFW